MKIQTQSCGPSARVAGTACAPDFLLLFTGARSRRAANAKRASGLRCRLLGQAPELKSFGVDCLFDRVAREFMGWSLLRPDGARCGPRTQLLWKPTAGEIARESLQTFPRLRFENINPHDSTLSAVNDTYVCVAGGTASAARPCHPRNPRRCLLAARATAASTKQAAVTRARQIGSCTRHAPLVTGGSASGLSATGACMFMCMAGDG
jgi:hypothetical protein